VVAAPEAEELAPVVDIMEALRSSLEALKKPVEKVVEFPDAERKIAGKGSR
jgi:non-homologous end joining protein Ku